MIPTREQIDEHYSVNALAWLRAMRDEIDHLTFMGGLATKALTDAGWTLTGVEWKPPIGPNPSPLLEQIERLKAELGEANSARNSWKVGSEVLIADRDRCRTDLKAANETIAVLRKVADLSESVSDQLQADLDRANTEAALARDALAKATTPAPEREAAIRAWEEDATLHRCGSRFDDDDPRATYLMARSEITAAVALMRSADGKELLRELRWWLIARDLNPSSPEVRKIDELLARPAPSHVYSRGKTIAESADPPTAYYPPPPVEIWPEEMKRQTLVGKFEPAPVERPAAAVPDHVPDAGKTVPDDTRELVAQLADAVVTLCDGQGFGVTLSEVQAIAKQLRGGA